MKIADANEVKSWIGQLRNSPISFWEEELLQVIKNLNERLRKAEEKLDKIDLSS